MKKELLELEKNSFKIKSTSNKECITKTNLRTIPNVGKRTKESLMNIGINCLEDLIGKNPEDLYEADCNKKGFREDKCQLYLFRMAIYYAENKDNLEEEKLKWWYWKDK